MLADTEDATTSSVLVEVLARLALQSDKFLQESGAGSDSPRCSQHVGQSVICFVQLQSERNLDFRLGNWAFEFPIQRDQVSSNAALISHIQVILEWSTLHSVARILTIVNDEWPEILVTTRMRARRLSLGLSQQALGFRAGVASSDVSKFENGWARPYPGQAKRLAKALRLSAGELQEAEADVGGSRRAATARGRS